MRPLKCLLAKGIWDTFVKIQSILGLYGDAKLSEFGANSGNFCKFLSTDMGYFSKYF